MGQRVPPRIPEKEIPEAVFELKSGAVDVHPRESQVTEVSQIRRTPFAHGASVSSSRPKVRSAANAAS